MPSPRSIVIVGAGLAGAHAAFALRDAGYGGAITVVGAEANLPYERPPLSKDYLRGETPQVDTLVRAAADYAGASIELVLGRRAVDIERARRRVVLDDGQALPYDGVILATGSEPIRLAAEGARLAGVHHLRAVEDADAIAGAAADAEHVVVVGGGWIGAEVAASLRQLGRDVTLVMTTERPLERVLGRAVAGIYAEVHRQNGVRLVVGRVDRVEGRQTAEAVRLADGTRLPAQAVVVGIGARPDVTLPARAGLTVAGGGVAVDELLRTDDPAIVAAGDIAAAYHPVYGMRVRVEHWDNAIEQGKAAALTLLGQGQPYVRRPYFYSDQFDLGMEYRGRASAVDDVVISGDPDARAFSAFWLDGRRIVAAMHVNRWQDGERLQALVEEAPHVDRERLRIEGASLGAELAAV